MADPTGFEPAISSVTGWHVGPLHHGSVAATGRIAPEPGVVALLAPSLARQLEDLAVPVKAAELESRSAVARVVDRQRRLPTCLVAVGIGTGLPGRHQPTSIVREP